MTLSPCRFLIPHTPQARPQPLAGIHSEEQVTAAFTQAALAIGLQAAEVVRTLASARTAGLANPRTVPSGPGHVLDEDRP